MRIIGLICEYNPFHLGHLYQIKKIKKKYPDSLLIVILSGCFMQRGEVSIINKWDKTRICLENNIDIVVELPFVFATQSSDIFAKGALFILNHLGIDTLVFGSETNNLDNLFKLAKIQLYDKKYDHKLKDYLNEGVNYPTASSKALEDISSIRIDKPNDLLGLSYVKEIIKNDYKIEVFTIKRTNDYHGDEFNSNIVSASYIRKCLSNNLDISSYVPSESLKYLNNKYNFDLYFKFLKYKIITNIDNLYKFQTVDEGIENRIKKYIFKSNTLDEFIKNVKTKRYTYNKIMRMCSHILCDFTKVEANNLEVDYIFLLGFNSKGRCYLNKIKKENIPIISKYDEKYFLLNIEKRVSRIYALLTCDDNYLKDDSSNKPIIKSDYL